MSQSARATIRRTKSQRRAALLGAATAAALLACGVASALADGGVTDADGTRVRPSSQSFDHNSPLAAPLSTPRPS